MKKKLRTAVCLLLSGCLMSANVMAATTTFSDVPSSYWGYQYVTRAASEGLVSGMGDGTYGVNAALSNAQFVTMICNLFYKTEVDAYQKANKPNEWWRSYMEVAYSKKLLTNTTVVQGRDATKAWSADDVNAEISRYDMAQIMVNLSDVQKWQSVSGMELLAAKVKIADWDQIPTKYQTAVATAYAKEFLSGMDSKGTFAGDQSMTRTHGAVVLCKLMDAKKSEAAAVYTNTTNLVNGSTPTEANVKTALTALKKEFPNNYVWDVTKTYTSNVLGASYGCDAFVYTLSDRVFGTLKATTTTSANLKAGDMVFLRDNRTYALVLSVDGDEFDYVYCDTNGKVSWNNTAEISDLNSKDTIYTRYKVSSSSSSSSTSTTKLSNGKTATETNVSALITTFLKNEYAIGDRWDMEASYKSTAFVNRSVTGDRAFVYYFSDYIFGKLAVEEDDNVDNVRVGDVLYLDVDDEYVMVQKVSGNVVTYIGVTTRGTLYSDTVKISDLGKNDNLYTRYPSSSSTSSSTLANGKAATEKNVASALTTFQRDKYANGDYWDMDASYKSTAFYSKSVTGTRAFAYYVSDEIFGSLKVSTSKISKIRVGDVIYLYDEDEYIIAVEVDGSELTYAGLNSRGRISWGYVMDLDDLDSDDEVYTRYPASTTSSTDTLANGKAATEKNVTSALTTFQDKEYGEGERWGMETSYRSSAFSSKSVTGEQAFAYYVSDTVFGDLDVSATRLSKLRVGDVIYLYDEERYGVVVDVGIDEITYAGVSSTGRVSWSYTFAIDDFDSNDEFYTRYPA